MLLLVAGAASADGGLWGRDINPGQGPKLLDEARPRLLEVVKAPEDIPSPFQEAASTAS